MRSFITGPKIINEIRADERAGPKGLPSHLKSEYAIFDNQRDSWARDPNRIKGRSQSVMPPEMKYHEGSVMKFVNKNRNKTSGSLLHYNKNFNEKDQGDFLDLISLSNFSLNASLKNSVTLAYPFSGCSLMNFSTSSYNATGILNVLYFLSICYDNVINYINDIYYPSIKYNRNVYIDFCVIHNIWKTQERVNS
jgi:hypothetical protein